MCQEMNLCAATNSGHQTLSSVVQLVEQRLGLLQIERVEAFGEPAVDRSENFSGLIPLALIVPEPRHGRRGAEFPGFSLLLTRNRERALVVTSYSRDVTS